MNIGSLLGLTKLISGKWLVLGAMALSAAGSAWAAHSWTKSTWEAHHEAYKSRAFQAAVDAVTAQHELWLEQSAVREARLSEYREEIRAIQADLEEARGETRVIYREIPTTDAGECRFTDDGVRLLERAAAAANRAAGAAAGTGEAGGGDGEHPGVPGAAG